MIGRPRSSSHWRIRIVNLVLLTLILVPTIASFVWGYDQWLRAQQTPKYYVPNGTVGIIKVLENKGISFKGKDAMNVLVLGIDYNWTDVSHLPYSQGARSDTMFVLHLNSDGSRLGMLTIPRDMYIDLPDHKGRDKINGAFSEGGVAFARKTVEQFLGIKIQHYVVLRIDGAKKLVDALGGVDLVVEKNMNYDDNWGYLHVHLKKGMQHLNGEQTVGYARFRHDEESDFGRIRRQQQVVDTLIKKLKQPSNYTPQKLESIASLFKEYVETDFNVPLMLDLAHVYESFDRKNFVTGFIPGTDGDVGGMSVLYPPDRTTIRTKVHQVLLGGNNMEPQDVSIEVLNASDLHGAAGRLGDSLASRGYNVVRVADYAGTRPPNSAVVVHGADPGLLRLVPHIVPRLPVGDDVQYPYAAGQNTDKDTLVTVILAPDWGPSPSPAPADSPLLETAVPNPTITVYPSASPSEVPSSSP